MQWELLEGDALERLKDVASESVQVCVTSPPYWQLRDYKVAGQIGLEVSLEEYVRKLVAVFAEVKRCLHSTGTLWVNIADTYNNFKADQCKHVRGQLSAHSLDCMPRLESGHGLSDKGLKYKDLCNVPHKFCDAMKLDGWYHRSTMILAKPAPMPESVSSWRWERCRVKTKPGNGYSASKGLVRADGTMARNPDSSRNPDLQAAYLPCDGCDKCRESEGLVLRKGSWRPTRSYEFLFLFAKSHSYFCDGERVRTALAVTTKPREKYTRIQSAGCMEYAVKHDHDMQSNPAGANLRDVIRWKAEPLRLKHYAAFPSFIPELAIKAGTSERGNCANCGMPVVRVVAKVPTGEMQKMTAGWDTGDGAHGWRASCECAFSTLPPLVLDPFVGTGTTIIAALRLGCRAIGVELSPEYVALAKGRINGAVHSDSERAKVPLFEPAA